MRDEFDAIYRFWFDRGISGFRIDVCHAVVKDKLLRDNPPSGPDDDWHAKMYGQHFVYNTNRPEVHDVLRRWRAARRLRTTRRECSWERPTCSTRRARLVLRPGRRAQPRVQLHRCCTPKLRCARAAHRGGTGRGADPVGRVADMDRRQPRQPSLGYPMVRRRRRQDPHRDGDAHGPAGNPVPLLRRRDRHARHDWCPTIVCSTRSARCSACAVGSRRRAHADALDSRSRRGVQRARRGAVAAVRQLLGVQRGRPVGRPGVDVALHA